MFPTAEEREQTELACRFCPMCAPADVVGIATRREHLTPRGRAMVLHAIGRGLHPLDADVAEALYAFTVDGLCRQWCVGNFDYDALILDARARALQAGVAPIAVRRVVERCREGRAPHDEVPVDPMAILRREGVAAASRPEVLVAFGCTALHRRPGPAQAFGRILAVAGVAAGTADGAGCCGAPLYFLGDFEGAARRAATVAAAIRASSAHTLVCLDGQCHRMFTTRYARLGAPLENVTVVHATEFAADLLERGLLSPKSAPAGRVTYHDPCHLVRYADVVEAPRRILRRLYDDRFVEMRHHGALARCCGAGGGLPFTNPEIARAVAALRLDEARTTHADVLATACPSCAATLAPEAREGPAVCDVLELLADAL